jgi:hypothetical protein
MSRSDVVTQSNGMPYLCPYVLAACLVVTGTALPSQAVSGNGCGEDNTPVVTASVDATQQQGADRLQRRFEALAQQWRAERGSMSSIDQMSILTPYQNIIGMGIDALPLILGRLRAEGDDPDQWFWALLTIAEANDLNPPQVAAEDQGNYQKMARAWLEWGESLGYAG